MQKWEYLYATSYSGHVTTHVSNEHIEQEISTDLFLQRSGEDGWELVAVTYSPSGSGSLSFFFKRPY